MVVLLVVLVGILAGLKLTGKEKTEEQATETGIPLTELTAARISGVSYQYQGGAELHYVLKNKAWKNADDENFPISSDAFANNFVAAFVDMKTAGEVEAPQESSQYGFDDPYLTVKITGTQGEEETFTLGDYNAMLKGYYLKIGGKEGIYYIGTDLTYICRSDMYDYAKVESFPTYSTDTLKSLTVQRDGQEVSLLYYPDGYKTDQIGLCKWFFGSPFSYPRSAETNKIEEFETNILNKIQFVKLVNYKPTPEELEAYGLTAENRRYIIEDNYTKDSGAVTDRKTIVDFGAYDQDTDCYYARITTYTGITKEASDNIYLISKANVETLLGLDPLNYVYKQVTYIKLSEIADPASDITFTTPQGNYVLKNNTTFNEDGSEKENIYLINDQPADEKSVEDFYYEILANCGMEQIIYDKSTIVTDKEPTYTITYHRNNGSYTDNFYGAETVVTYTEYNSNYYQASVNGVTDVLVNKRVLDETMELLQQMK